MAKVDKAVLADVLDQLTATGFLQGWQARPLGMYMLHLNTGDVLRPDAKETAQFVQGLSYGAMVGSGRAAALADESGRGAPTNQEAARRALGLSPDLRQATETLLDSVIEREVDDADDPATLLRNWSVDDDGDYLLTHGDGHVVNLYAEQALAQVILRLGSHGVFAPTPHPDAKNGDPEAARRALGLSEPLVDLTGTLLDALVEWNDHQPPSNPKIVLEEWSLDDDGDYLLTYADGHVENVYAEIALAQVLVLFGVLGVFSVPDASPDDSDAMRCELGLSQLLRNCTALLLDRMIAEQWPTQEGAAGLLTEWSFDDDGDFVLTYADGHVENRYGEDALGLGILASGVLRKEG